MAKIQQQDRRQLKLHSLASVDFNLKAIPQDLKTVPQWVPCHIIDEEHPSPKQPIGGPTNVFSQMSFTELVDTLDFKRYQHFGICLNNEDDIVCIDVDSLPEDFTLKELPKRIQDLLEMRPSYAEISPSGRGIHIYYRTNKTLLAHRRDRDSNTNKFQGEIFLRNQFVTVTGHKLPNALPSLASIDASLLESIVFAPAKVKAIRSSPGQKGLKPALVPQHTLDDIERWLAKIPPNLSASSLQPALNRIYQRFSPPIEAPTDYMHWQYVTAMIHHAADSIGEVDLGEELHLEWSLLGDNEGEYHIRQKYRDNAPKYDDSDLTYLSLVKLANGVQPVWPYPKTKIIKGETVILKQPQPQVIENWQALFKFFGLALTQNEVTKAYRVTGPAQTVEKYFVGEFSSKESMQSSVLYFAQLHGLDAANPQNSNSYAQWWANHRAETYNPIKEWIDNAPPLTQADKSVSWFQALWETLELHEHDKPREELYRSYLKKNLMGLIRAHYYTGQFRHSTGVVILFGGEGSRKSSWVAELLPPHLKDYVFPSQADISKDMKELSMEAASCAIWLKDEIDGFLHGTKRIGNKDALIKSFFVQADDAYRPLFSSTTTKVPRKCIFFGTTNEPELSLSGTGNRRIQIIPVKYCDTDKFTTFPIVKVYQELLAEFNAVPQKKQPKLWVLDEEEEKLTNTINTEEHKTENSLDAALKDLYDFETPYNEEDYLTERGVIDGDKLTTLRAVGIQLTLTGIGRMGTTPPGLKHSLRRIVGAWTDSIKSARQLPGTNWSIEQGIIKRRAPGTGAVIKQGYPTPKLKEEIK